MNLITLISLLVPYLAVAFGLYACRSAWAAVLLYHAGILLFLGRAGIKNAFLRFRTPASFSRVFLFGLSGLTAGALLYFLWPFIDFSPRLSSALIEWGLNRQTWPWFIAYGGLVNPWLEEAFWRDRLGSAALRPILADAIFAGFHLVILFPFLSLPWLVVAFLMLSFAGWLWRQAARLESSLLASALFHLAADVSILLVVVSKL